MIELPTQDLWLPIRAEYLRGSSRTVLEKIATDHFGTLGADFVDIIHEGRGYRAVLVGRRYITDGPPRLVSFAPEEASDDTAEQSTDSD